MKLQYRQIIEYLTAAAGRVSQPDEPAKPLLAELLAADGMPTEAAVRLRTIRDDLQRHANIFTEQRDAILAKHNARIDEAAQAIVPADLPEEPTEEETEAAAARLNAANTEIAKLLEAQVEGIRTIRASTLTPATGDAYTLLLTDRRIDWLWPIITDDLPK